MTHHVTEEQIEQRTNMLLQDLEVAKDPVAYRQRYHRRSAEQASSRVPDTPQRNRPAAAALSKLAIRPPSPALSVAARLFLTALAIALGTLMGSLLSLHVL